MPGDTQSSKWIKRGWAYQFSGLAISLIVGLIVGFEIARDIAAPLTVQIVVGLLVFSLAAFLGRGLLEKGVQMEATEIHGN